MLKRFLWRCLKPTRLIEHTLLLLFSWALLTAPCYSQTSAEWTISIYIAADNDLDPFAVSDLNEMAAIGSSEKVNIIVQVDRLDRAAGSGVKRYRIEKGKPLGEGTVTQLPELNMGGPDTLVDFVEWSHKAFPAKRHAVVVWSHGSGWREANLALPRNQPTQDNAAKPTKAIAFDDGSDDRLYQAEVEDAFERLRGKGVRIDLIGFDACLMSMIEVWYGLAPYAAVGVGSQDLEPGYGWDYRRLLGGLLARPSLEPSELGTLIVATFADSIEKSKSSTVRMDRFTLAAIDLSKVEALSAALNSLIILLNDVGTVDAITQARAEVAPFAFKTADAWPNGVDLTALAKAIRSTATTPSVRSAAQEVESAAAAAVITNRYSANNQLLRANGISVYFPKTKAIWDKDPEGAAYRKDNTFQRSKFVAKHGWPDFLRQYHEGDLKRARSREAPSTDTSFAEAERAPKKQTSRAPKLDDLCLGSQVNESKVLSRSSLIFRRMKLGSSDFLDLDMALLRTIDQYCRYGVDPTAKGAITREDAARLANIAMGAESPALTLYFFIRLFCEQDNAPPRSLDLRDAFLSILKLHFSDAYAELQSLFTSELNFEVAERKVFPTPGSVALYFDTYFRLREAETVPPRESASDRLLRLQAFSLAASFTAEAYLELARQPLTIALNKRLVYGQSVWSMDAKTRDALDQFDRYCQAIAAFQSEELKEGTVFSAAISQCLFDQMLVGFLNLDADRVLKVGDTWLARSVAGKDKLADKLRPWLGRWYLAWAHGQKKRFDRAQALFDDAFGELKLVQPAEVDRTVVRSWATLFQNATITADLGRAQDTPYLFFCQWIAVLTQANAPKQKLLQVIERSRLYDGSSPIVTAYFAQETLLLDRLGQDESTAINPAKLRNVIQILDDRILAADFLSAPSNTVVYFFNAWMAKSQILIRSSKEWLLREEDATILGATLGSSQPTDAGLLSRNFSEFMQPIWNDLSGDPGTRLRIIPHMYSNRVPFAALSSKDGLLLIDRFAISYHSSLTSITGQVIDRTKPSVLLVHSPLAKDQTTFPTASLARGDDEAAQIKARFGSINGTIRVLARESATRKAIIHNIKTSNILHVIAHGLSLASDPLKSAVVLTPDDDQDSGLLTIEQMLQWKAKLDVVMLAGCETGQQPGEGVFLAGFAGLATLGIANYVGLALWKLSDASGALLMGEFYNELAQGKPPAEALRQAQIAAREQYSDPSLWAPIVLYASD